MARIVVVVVIAAGFHCFREPAGKKCWQDPRLLFLGLFLTLASVVDTDNRSDML